MFEPEFSDIYILKDQCKRLMYIETEILLNTSK